MKKVKDIIKEYRSYIGCCLLVLIHTGINSIATAAMPYLREYYGCELSTIIKGASVCSFIMFFASLVGAKFIKAVKPKGSFYVASLCAAIYCFLIYITDSVWGFYVGCGSVGFTAAWGGYATSTIFVHKYHSKNAGTLITGLLSVGMLGGAGFQFISGFLLTRIGLRGLYLTMLFVCLFAFIINTLFISNIEAEEKNSTTKIKDRDRELKLYFQPIFIKMLIVTLCSSTLCGTFATLLTTFLMSHDVITELATTCLSAYTLIGGCVAMIGGVLADKFGYRFYITYLYSCFVIGILSAVLFNNTEIVIAMPMMLLFIAIASPSGSVYNMISKPIFKDDALLAQTKLMAVGSLSSAFVLPAFTKLYEVKGFNFVFTVQIIIAVLCLMLLLSALKTNTDN